MKSEKREGKNERCKISGDKGEKRRIEERKGEYEKSAREKRVRKLLRGKYGDKKKAVNTVRHRDSTDNKQVDTVTRLLLLLLKSPGSSSAL